MSNLHPELLQRLTASDAYRRAFLAAFDSADITSERVGLALEQFLLTLVAGHSKFDRVTSGQPRLEGAAPSAPTADTVRPAAGRLLASVSNFELALEDFAQSAGQRPALPRVEGDHASLRGMLGELAENRHLLRDWTTWCRVRRHGSRRCTPTRCTWASTCAVAWTSCCRST